MQNFNENDFVIAVVELLKRQHLWDQIVAIHVKKDQAIKAHEDLPPPYNLLILLYKFQSIRNCLHVNNALQPRLVKLARHSCISINFPSISHN
jgi:hypothetical protein